MNETLQHFKDELDFMLNQNNIANDIINQLTYQENDVRKDYFKTSYTNTYHYYISYINLLNSHLLKSSVFPNNEEVFVSFLSHFTRLKEITEQPMHCSAHFNTLNQRLLVMAWSLFELAISTFYEHIVDEAQLDKQFNEDYKEVLKCVDVKAGKENKLEKLLVKKSLHQIPIVRKYNYLLKIATNYSRNTSSDKDFLDFFGRLRNTVHSNFIFYGNHYTYKFRDAEFVFKNKEQVYWTNPFENGKLVPCTRLYFYLIENLNDIARAIFSSIPFENIISYPDLNAD